MRGQVQAAFFPVLQQRCQCGSTRPFLLQREQTTHRSSSRNGRGSCCPGALCDAPQGQMASVAASLAPSGLDLLEAVKQGDPGEVKRLLDAGAPLEWRSPVSLLARGCLRRDACGAFCVSGFDRAGLLCFRAGVHAGRADGAHHGSIRGKRRACWPPARLRRGPGGQGRGQAMWLCWLCGVPLPPTEPTASHDAVPGRGARRARAAPQGLQRPSASPSRRSSMMPAHRSGQVLSLFAYVTAQYGQTPLMWASKQGNADMVQMLIDRGASIEAKNEVRLPGALA